MAKRLKNVGSTRAPIFDPKDERGAYAEPVAVIEPGHYLNQGDVPKHVYDDLKGMDAFAEFDQPKPADDSKDGDK